MKNKAVKLLLYCTKAKPNLMDFNLDRKHFNIDYGGQVLNGKIVAEAECDLVEDLSKYQYTYKDSNFYDVLKNACLTTSNLDKYCPCKRGEYKKIYAIHLKNVKPLYDSKELSEYSFFEPNHCLYRKVKKAPQNMCRVVLEGGHCVSPKEEYVLISIKPEWLCKILNGEKTIEVRKSILNVLKELIRK